MNIEMIALDLDGTALGPDHLTISRELQKVLLQAHEQGIYVVPVTGRPYGLLPRCLLHHPQWESFGILCNGAEIRSLQTGAVLAHHPLASRQIQKIIALAKAYDLPAELNAGGRLYLTRRSLEKEMREPKLLFHCTVFLPAHGQIVRDLGNLAPMDVEKVHLNCISPELFPKLQKDLKALDVSVVCEKPPNLEVTHSLATKGRGLRDLCSRLQIPPAHVLAIGDSGNDLSMLQEAGLAVAMGSAPDFLQAEADYVTGTNLEDGAAAAIRRFAL